MKLSKLLEKYKKEHLTDSNLLREYCYLNRGTFVSVKKLITECINIDTFIEFMQDPCRKHKNIVIQTTADNITSWNFIKNIKCFYIGSSSNTIEFIVDNLQIYIMMQNDVLTTINYLLNTCTDATFSICEISVVQNKLEDSTNYNNNTINMYGINTPLPNNILTHNSVSTLYISTLDDNNFANLVLSNITTIKFNDIRISIELFKQFFDKNPTITNVYFLDANIHDPYHRIFINNTNVIELYIYKLKCSTMCDLLRNTTLEKLVVHKLIDECDITFISNNIKYLYIGEAFCAPDEVEILAQSQLLYCNVRGFYCDIKNFITEYPNSIALASLIKNQSSDKGLIKFANNLLTKKRTLQYFCDNNTVLEKQFDNEPNL